uniref:Sm domain-containing protein n=1 Tax=Haemonchus contortus TaxID=6289 RepID=A0A7I4YW43_HAECO
MFDISKRWDSANHINVIVSGVVRGKIRKLSVMYENLGLLVFIRSWEVSS